MSERWNCLESGCVPEKAKMEQVCHCGSFLKIFQLFI